MTPTIGQIIQTLPSPFFEKLRFWHTKNVLTVLELRRTLRPPPMLNILK